MVIQTGEVFDLVIPLMRGHTAGKSSQWQMLHELREYEIAWCMVVLGGSPQKTPSLAFDVQIETRLK